MKQDRGPERAYAAGTIDSFFTFLRSRRERFLREVVLRSTSARSLRLISFFLFVRWSRALRADFGSVDTSLVRCFRPVLVL